MSDISFEMFRVNVLKLMSVGAVLFLFIVIAVKIAGEFCRLFLLLITNIIS